MAAVLSSLLLGCSVGGSRDGASANHSSGRAADSNRPETHKVRTGDTLYAIAFRYGLDYREVAAWNGIGPPYLIRPGDRIRLRPAYGRWAANRPPPPATAESSARVTTTTAERSPVTGSTVQTRPLNDRAGAAEPVTVKPLPDRESAVVVVTPPPTPRPRPTVAVPVKPPAVASRPVARGTPQWRWPTDGEVIGEYSTASQLQRGLDIAGKIGQPVVAAAAGEVVYSGSGLVGYGELIIIKHNDVYLSAYGHNRRRFVKEGQQVTAGQKIAELGDTGANRAKLHFEIRENGQPIDPRKHLPKG